MIRQATVMDISELKVLWEYCYDDPMNYVDFMYDRLIKPADTIVYEEEGTIVSMASSMECQLTYKNQQLKCLYIFGLATLPKYEGRGFEKELVSRFEKVADGDGAQMCVLVAESAMKTEYFRRHGYSSDFYYRKLTLKAGQLGTVHTPNEGEITFAVPSDVYNIREQALYEIPHISWNVEQLELLMLDAATYYEKTLEYNGEYGSSYIIYGVRNGDLYVRECLGTSDDSIKCILAYAIDKADPKKVTLRFPIDTGILPYEGRKIRMGQGKSFRTKKTLSDFAPYMNLTID